MIDLRCGDWVEVLKTLPDESVHCCISSPPYWGLRDYGTAKWEGGDDSCDHKAAKEKSRFDYKMQEGSRQAEIALATKGTDQARWKDVCPACGAIRIDAQLGLEKTPEEYVAKIVAGFREVRRVLRKDGTLWLNLGDSYISGGRAGQGKHAYGGLEKGMSDCGLVYGLPTGIVEGLKPKDLVGIPWRVAFALQADGWWLRMDIIWHKPNPMPESVTDRPTKSHEYVFLMAKSGNAQCWKNKKTGEWTWTKPNIKQYFISPVTGKRTRLWESHDYYYDADAIAENGCDPIGVHRGGSLVNAAREGREDELISQNCHRGTFETLLSTGKRNKRSVWTIATQAMKEAHFATFPEKLVEPCILAGCPEGGTVLDPFAGTCTVGLVAARLNRSFIGIDLNPEYLKMRRKQIDAVVNQERLELGPRR